MVAVMSHERRQSLSPQTLIAATVTVPVSIPPQKQEHEQEYQLSKGHGYSITRSGAVDVALEWVVWSVLAGAQIIVLVRWAISKVSAVLAFAVELGMFLVQTPS